jgi:hypothetical protein
MISLRSRLVQFKEVFQPNSNSISIHVNPHWTTYQFINIVVPILSSHFKIPEANIEIIDAVQPHEGIPEMGKCVIPSIEVLCYKWGMDLNVSFYVRKKIYIYPELITILNKRKINAIFIGDCPVCLEERCLFRKYECCHGICRECFNCCRELNMCRCSLCRSN